MGLSASGAEFSPGDIVGKTYVIISYIGRGAMGVVYHARHIGLPKEYALKTLRSDQITDTAWFRFQMEAQSVAKMFHPNIVGIHNFGSHKTENGLQQPFYVMDFLHGDSLMERLRDQGPPPLAVILQVFIQAASGFGYAHSKGIIHRDVKPGNIMLLSQPDAMGASIKIVDFGIAKLTAEADFASQHLTRDGEIFGSPYYMSPEQSLGQPTDSRSDIYSLGVSLFETLTGEAPFTGPTALDIMLMHQGAPLPDINNFGDTGGSAEQIYPAALQMVIEQMTAKAPDQRYQTMEQVATDLWTILQGDSPDTLAPLAVAAGDVAGDLNGDLGSDGHSAAKADQGEEALDEEALDEEVDEEELDAEALAVKDLDAALQAGRAISRVQTIPVKTKLPAAQLAFLVITIATAAVAALIFFVSKSSHSAVSRVAPAIKKVMPAAVKIDLEEDKEPTGNSLNDTTPYCTIKTVKGQRVKSFDFPTDVLIGSISFWEQKSGQWVAVAVKAKGHLEYPHDEWLMFLPSRLIGKYPQYLKRFSKGNFAAFRLPEHSDSDAVLAACTAMPEVSEIKFYDTHNLTSQCIPSLSKFENITLLDASNSTISGANLAKARCFKKIKKLYYSKGTEVSPLLEKLKSCKELELIDVHETPLTYHDFKTLACLKTLSSLNISGMKVTKSQIAKLAQSKSLQELTMCDCGLDEDWIPTLRQFKGLKTLWFETTKTPIVLRDKFIAGLPTVQIK